MGSSAGVGKLRQDASRLASSRTSPAPMNTEARQVGRWIAHEAASWAQIRQTRGWVGWEGHQKRLRKGVVGAILLLL